MTLIITTSVSLESIFHKDVKEYRKTATVKATQVHESFTVQTLEGKMSGVAGDYLCEGINGEKMEVWH